jgi:hypothetical protein
MSPLSTPSFPARGAWAFFRANAPYRHHSTGARVTVDARRVLTEGSCKSGYLSSRTNDGVRTRPSFMTMPTDKGTDKEGCEEQRQDKDALEGDR